MSVSVIIPVYKEDAINQTLKRLRKHSALEVIVVDGEPSRSTLKKIQSRTVKKLASSPGRAHQMNLGAKKAKGDVLLFLHADTVLPKKAMQKIEQALKSADAGAFDLAFDYKHWWMRFVGWAASKRSRISKVPYGDQALFVKKSTFAKVGGYRGPFMEDVDLMRRLKQHNATIVFINDPVVTSARRWRLYGLLKTTLKNRLIMLLYNAGVSRKRLKRMYM